MQQLSVASVSGHSITFKIILLEQVISQQMIVYHSNQCALLRETHTNEVETTPCQSFAPTLPDIGQPLKRENNAIKIDGIIPADFQQGTVVTRLVTLL